MNNVIDVRKLAEIPDIVLDGNGAIINKGDTVYINQDWERPYIVGGFCISKGYSLDFSSSGDEIVEVKLNYNGLYLFSWNPNELYHKPNEK